MNIQGMKPNARSGSRWKLPYFQEHYLSASQNPVPLAAFTESWLKPYISDVQISIPNYNIVRADRIKRDRGGVIMYIHDSLPLSDIQTFDNDYCEGAIVTLEVTRTIIGCIYRPPDTPSHKFDELVVFLNSYIASKMEDQHYEIILMGDFNFPSIDWNIVTDSIPSTNNDSKGLFSLMSNHLLSQYILTPTRINNILDLFLTNNPNLVLHSSSTKTKLSDHNIIQIETTASIDIETYTSNIAEDPHTFKSIDMHKLDLEALKEHLKTIDWEQMKDICPDEDFPELFRLTVLQCCLMYGPIKEKSTNVKREYHIPKERRNLHRKKKKIKKKLNKLQTQRSSPNCLLSLQRELESIHEKITNSIFEQQDAKEKKAIQNIKKNPKYFFSYAKKARKAKVRVGPLFDTNGKLQTNPEVMANILQDQYSSVFSDPTNPDKIVPKDDDMKVDPIYDIPITKEEIIKAITEISENSATTEDDIPAIILRNCKNELATPIMFIWEFSMRTGFIHSIYKTQIITPVHKKESRAVPANYRPISLTSHVIKIFERIVRNKLVTHLENNCILCKNQHGFRKGRSCLTQLLKHIDDILRSLNEGSDTDVLYLDFAKAFDKVDHEILLAKLSKYQIKGNLYNWLQEYLKDRNQFVVVNGSRSHAAHVKSGVPQGTVLGPILFLIYINDMEQCAKNCVISHFADDSRVKKAINYTSDVDTLQNSLNSIVQWSKENNMSLHEKKFEYLSHSAKKHKLIQELPYINEYYTYTTPAGIEICPQSLVKDLGINISSDLSWTPHINIITDTAKRMASWCLSVFRCRGKEVMLTLFKTYVRSRLEFSCPLWNPHKITDIQTLESVQRNFTSKIDGLSEFNYWERLKLLKLHSLQRRRERYIIIHMFKIRMNLTSNDLNIQFATSPRRGILAILPQFPKQAAARNITLFESSFAVNGPLLWNILPPDVRLHTKLEPFKISLSKFLDTVPDEPPVTGYVTSHYNSLRRLRKEGGSRNGDWPL